MNDYRIPTVNKESYQCLLLAEKDEYELTSDSLQLDKGPTCDNLLLVLAVRNPLA